MQGSRMLESRTPRSDMCIPLCGYVLIGEVQAFAAVLLETIASLS